jgi:hypothetical protein
LLEVGYRDAVTAARIARDDARTKARGRVRESANPRLKFGEAAERWLSEQVSQLRPSTA